MTLWQEADLMARVLEDDILFRCHTNMFNKSSFITLKCQDFKQFTSTRLINLKQFGFQGLAFHLSTPALWSRLYSWAGSGKIGQMDLEIDIFWIVYFFLEYKKVGDSTDGKLVHLDGLNFSRAWGLYRNFFYYLFNFIKMFGWLGTLQDCEQA